MYIYAYAGRCISEHVKRSVVSLYELSRGGRNDPLRVNRPVFRPMARVLIHRAIEQGAPAYNVDHSAEFRETSLHDRHIKHQAAMSNPRSMPEATKKFWETHRLGRSSGTLYADLSGQSFRCVWGGSNCPIRYLCVILPVFIGTDSGLHPTLGCNLL